MQNLIPSLGAVDHAKKCGWPTRPESMKFCSGSFSILAGGDFLGWKSGSEPRHGHGEALIALWCMATASDRKKLPTVLHRQWFTFRKSRFGRETDQVPKPQ